MSESGTNGFAAPKNYTFDTYIYKIGTIQKKLEKTVYYPLITPN